MSKAKFPKRIYVKREYEPNDRSSWLVAQETPEGIVEADESVPVAIYERITVVRATAKTELK